MVLPAGMSTPATVGAGPGHAELGPQRALEPQRLLDEVGDAVAVLPQPLLDVGALGDDPQREGQQAHRRLLPAGEEVGGEEGDVVDLGRRAVGERGRRHRRHDVVARVAPAVLDVGAELLVEELERLVPDLLGSLASRS